MRSIKARFLSEKHRNIYLSDLVNFASAITGQDFTRKRIHGGLNNFVDSEDYNHLNGYEKKELMTWLESL